MVPFNVLLSVYVPLSEELRAVAALPVFRSSEPAVIFPEPSAAMLPTMVDGSPFASGPEISNA